MNKIYHFLGVFCLLGLNSYTFAKTSQSNSKDSPLESKVSLGDKHIIVLSSDHEFMWGSYYFGVHNKSGKKQPFTSAIMLPQNTQDFKAQQGLTENEITLGGKNHIVLQKEFDPGLSLVSIAFKVPLSQWDTQSLVLFSPYPINELSIASLKHLDISFEDPQAIPTIPNMLDPDHYSGITYKNVDQGQKLHIRVLGLPSGNALSWVICAISFTFLITLVCFFLKRDTAIKI